MIIDCTSEEMQRDPRFYKCYLNGSEVYEVWYVDTDAGLLKTYSVLEDPLVEHRRHQPIGTRELTSAQRERGIAEGWEMPEDGRVSRIMRGLIELRELGDVNTGTEEDPIWTPLASIRAPG